MKNLFANFALVDVGSSKVALVVPKIDGRTGGSTSAELSVKARCCIVEPVEIGKMASSIEIARAEALRRARHRAESMLRLRLRKVFLLANEPSLSLVSPSQTHDEKTIVINVAATDRNKRPLYFYAMHKQRWQFYGRLASYAGLSIVGFVFPAVALGQSLLAHRRALKAEETQAGRKAKLEQKIEAESSVEDQNKPQNFVIIDIGSRTTGVAVFVDGVPCACRSWEFGTASITTALAESFSLTQARAADLQRSLVLPDSFLNRLLDPSLVEPSLVDSSSADSSSASSSQSSSSHSASPALSERRFPRAIFPVKDTFSNSNSNSPKAAPQHGAVRVVVSAYRPLFAEVARFLKGCSPSVGSFAPVYAAGGGSLLVGSHVLAGHLLARCVLPYPYLGSRVATRAFGERIAASGALACLSVLSREGVLMPALPTPSLMSRWPRRLKIFSSRNNSHDSFPPPKEETSHA